MKIKTDEGRGGHEGKEHYDLWFILEGRGTNQGSLLQARCKFKGGRDGGCKHIAAAMYFFIRMAETEINTTKQIAMLYNILKRTRRS